MEYILKSELLVPFFYTIVKFITESHHEKEENKSFVANRNSMI